MIVCLCKAVTDHELREVIRHGAHSMRELGRLTGAGTDCGACRAELRRLLHDERRNGRAAAEAAHAQGPESEPEAESRGN